MGRKSLRQLSWRLGRRNRPKYELPRLPRLAHFHQLALLFSRHSSVRSRRRRRHKSWRTVVLRVLQGLACGMAWTVSWLVSVWLCQFVLSSTCLQEFASELQRKDEASQGFAGYFHSSILVQTRWVEYLCGGFPLQEIARLKALLSKWGLPHRM